MEKDLKQLVHELVDNNNTMLLLIHVNTDLKEQFSNADYYIREWNKAKMYVIKKEDEQ